MKLSFSTLSKRVPSVRFCFALSLIALSLPLFVTAGCGGGGSHGAAQSLPTRKTGGLSLNVIWPARTRLIPLASESIVLTVSRAGFTTRAVTLNRPAENQPLMTVAKFDDLPVASDYTVTAAAFPAADGTGTAQARSTATVVFPVVDGERTALTIAMDSTVETISLSPALSYPLGAGRSRRFTAVPLDKDGNIVLTSTEKMTFTLAEETAGTATFTADDSTAALDANLAVTSAPATGRVKLTLTATDAESGKSGSLDVFVSATGLSSEASWAKFHGDARNTGRAKPGIAAATGELEELFSGAGSIVFSSPVVGPDGTVYIGAYDNKVRAISANGTVLWEVTTGNVVEATPALSNDGALYVGSADGQLYCIDAATGAVRYTVAVDGEILGSPVVSPSGIVFFGTSNPGGTMYAVDGLSGEIKWQRAVSSVQATPALAGTGDAETLYFGTESGLVYALRATDGGDVYTPFQAEDAVITSSCAIGDNGDVYFGTISGKLYCLNADLSLDWEFDAEAPIYATPAISQDGTAVYFGTLDNFSGLNQSRIFALNADGGTIVGGNWPFAVGNGVTASAAVGADGTIYATSLDRNLYALDSDGTLKYNVAIGGDTPPDDLAIESSPGFGADGAIYFGSTDGKINVVR